MATTKKDVRAKMRKQLGRNAADAILSKAAKMAKRGAAASAIEKAIEKDISKHIQRDRELIPIIWVIPAPLK